MRAEYFTKFNSAEELEGLLRNKNAVNPLILGGGSNLLFVDDYPGLVMKNNIDFIEIAGEDKDTVWIKAGAGVNWHRFVLFCVNKNLGGLENLSLIPGNVGASPMQNIGAYGVEIKDVFDELEAYDLKERTIRKFTAADCEFGYRESIFKRKYKGRFVILNVTYRLKKVPAYHTGYGAVEEELQKMGVKNLSVKAISDAIINIRLAKLPDPARIGNAGSFFKNPVVSRDHFLEIQEAIEINPPGENGGRVIPAYKLGDEQYKIPAAWLIEQCGWKGFRRGDAGCYPKQPLVLVNYGQAKGKEIYDLSEEIILSVQKRFGIVLEREVNIVGNLRQTGR